MISPQRRRGAEISAEKTVGDGEWWRVRGVRFDAETRRRGGRRGERERVGARDPCVGRGGARRKRREKSPSFARIDRLKPVPPRHGGARRQRRARREESPSFARIGKLKHAPPRHGAEGRLAGRGPAPPGQAGGLSYLFFQLRMSALIPSPPGWPSAPRETISGSSAWCSPGKR